VVPEEKWTVSSNCSIKEDVEDMSLIIDALPRSIGKALMELERVDLNTLIEIIMDLGRPPRARFAGSDGAMQFVDICKEDATSDDLEFFCDSVTNFDHENR
jgi:stage III sporulation protein SpoIIIAA